MIITIMYIRFPDSCHNWSLFSDQQLPFSPTSQPAVLPFYSASVSSAFLESTRQWYHTVCVFLWLTSLSLMSSRSTYVAVNSRIPSLWWNNIPSCVMYIYIHLYLHCIFIFFPHFFFVVVEKHWSGFHQFSSVQLLSHVRLCDPMNCSTPGLPVLHQLLEPTQTHVHWVSDAIQPSHPLSSPSPPALNLSQHLGLFKWVSSSHEVAKVLEFQLQHQSFQWTPRTDLL